MDRLILLRHGKAESESLSGDDFDRRLAPRGVTESAAMARTLAELGFLPDVALVSPAARTRDTWAAAEAAFPGAKVSFDGDLYHSDSEGVRRAALVAGRTAGTVLVVGHNPGLQELTVRLLMEGHAPSTLIHRAQHRFPTAAASVFLFDAEGRPNYDGLFYPERGH
jgi:phosphohistidine phosphatase